MYYYYYGGYVLPEAEQELETLEEVLEARRTSSSFTSFRRATQRTLSTSHSLAHSLSLRFELRVFLRASSFSSSLLGAWRLEPRTVWETWESLVVCRSGLSSLLEQTVFSRLSSRPGRLSLFVRGWENSSSNRTGEARRGEAHRCNLVMLSLLIDRGGQSS